MDSHTARETTVAARTAMRLIIPGETQSKPLPALGLDALISVVIPIYNEEVILERAVHNLIAKLNERKWNYEIWLAENGSKDATVEIAHRLQAKFPAIRLLHCAEPNYGLALRTGIFESLGPYVICDEIDLGQIIFYERALEELLAGADLVVGSKRMRGSVDHRPWIRRFATGVMSRLLNLTLGFGGTDTHGPKAFRRDRLVSVVRQCVAEHDLFASELVIRAERAGLRVQEIPLELEEMRAPSIHLFRRVPRVLKNLARLVYVIRFDRAR